MSSFGWIKRKRKKLMDKDPHCYWCGIEVVYYQVDGFAKLPNNFATIDHLATRLEPDERQHRWKCRQDNSVLACNKCNQDRNNEKMELLEVRKEQKVRNYILQIRKGLGITTPRHIFLKQAKMGDLSLDRSEV